MSLQYQNPPLVEALCEFRFSSAKSWDMTIPGLLYERLRVDFPNREQQTGVRLGIEPQEEGFRQSLEIPQKVIFRRDDGSGLVQVGPNILAVNQLQPYGGWESFHERILGVLTQYWSIAEPEGLDRVGLRYINDITLPHASVELDDFFTYGLRLPDTISDRLFDFHVRSNIYWNDTDDYMILKTHGLPKKAPDPLTVRLDMDYVGGRGERVLFDDVSQWLQKAHTAVKSAFEACITPECRKLFGGELNV